MPSGKLFTIVTIFLSIISTLALAQATVSITPDSWASLTSQQMTLSVGNNGNSEIVMLELAVPQVGNTPLFYINDVTRPEGWTYKVSSSKVTWFAKGAGIPSGSSLNLFGIDAKPYEAKGNYQWLWSAADSKGAISSGSVYTSVGQSALLGFEITGMPSSTTAGSVQRIVVRALGTDGKIKSDYTGTVSFSSSDNASLPRSYTFVSSDQGAKDFIITYYAAGNQAVTVTDSYTNIASTSTMTNVKPAQAASISVVPASSTASIGDKIVFSVMAYDKFNNSFNVTDKASFAKSEGGVLSKNVFLAAKEGDWVAIATYNGLTNGAIVRISSSAVPYTPAEETASVTLTIPNSIKILSGSNDTAIVSVKNDGNSTASVRIVVEGIQSSWVSVQPLESSIPANGSKDFLVVLSVPENESVAETVSFEAVSGSHVLASKSTSLIVSGAPTGAFLTSKNFMQLGIIVIAISAVVIIGWEIWFKKKKY